jgi:signal transduction histidine kinase
MTGGKIIKKIVFSSLFLAGIPAILIMIFLPPLGSKYKLDIVSAGIEAGKYGYSDLNSDSISEKILVDKGVPLFYIVVRDLDDQIYDQWNIKDSLNKYISGLFFGNFDHDRFKELYIFSYKEDSLFLNINEILEPSGTRLERIFITKIGYLNGEVAAVLKPAGFYDSDGDGKDELYFSISSYYRLGSRRLYSYNIANRSLKASQITGSICLDPQMADGDLDQRPEIFGTMSASGNYPANVPFSDSSTWFMVFDDRLNFEFPPVEFPGFANGLSIKHYKDGNFSGYILSHRTGGVDTTVLKSRIMIYSGDGKLLRYRQYDEFVSTRNISMLIIKSFPSDKIIVVADRIFELNDNLDVIRSVDLPFNSRRYFYQADVNGDGEDEILVYSENESKLAVYSSNLHRLDYEKFRTPDNFWKFYNYLDRDHQSSLFLGSGEEGYFLNLRENRYFFLGFLVYPGIYLFFYLFIVLIKRINTNQLKVKENINRRLLSLQLQGIKSQLDPHFTFNTLNSVASLIYLDDRQAAYDYMHKFTRLLRSMLNDAEKIFRNLGEELDFVTTYLDLEKLRFGDKLNYEIEVGEGISKSEQVPKLVLQTFVENAVKHGIMPSTEGGLIKIHVIREKDYLRLTVEDNGIGREKSAGTSTSTGKGLKLTSEFYDILNHMNNRPIRYQITDLYDSSQYPSGTKVEVWVPVD